MTTQWTGAALWECCGSVSYSQCGTWQMKNKLFMTYKYIYTVHTVYILRSFLRLCCQTSILGDSGWGRLWRTYRNQLCNSEISQCVTTADIKTLLDSGGISYKNYELPSQMDITECFTEGDEKGELLLDFLTEVLDFSKTAPPELKAGVLELLRHPDCSVETNGRVIFNNNLGVIVTDSPQ